MPKEDPGFGIQDLDPGLRAANEERVAELFDPGLLPTNTSNYSVYPNSLDPKSLDPKS
jgi:hypothetical protein